MLLKQILSNAASATVLLNTAPLPASMPDMSPTPAANEQSILVLNSLSRRLNSLLVGAFSISWAGQYLRGSSCNAWLKVDNTQCALAGMGS